MARNDEKKSDIRLFRWRFPDFKLWKFPNIRHWKIPGFRQWGEKPAFAFLILFCLTSIAFYCFPPHGPIFGAPGASFLDSSAIDSSGGTSHDSGSSQTSGDPVISDPSDPSNSSDPSDSSSTSGTPPGSSGVSSSSSTLTPTSGPPVLQLSYAEVAVPSDFASGASVVPGGFFLVPVVQQTMWMPALSLFPGASACTMFLWTDDVLVDTVMTAGYLEGTPTDPSLGSSVAVGTVVENVGFLIAIRTENDITQTEILHVNLVKNETGWNFSPVYNSSKGSLALTQQLRIVSPRCPLTKEQTDDLSRLVGFDPASLGASGKAPFRMRTAAVAPMMEMLAKAQADLPALTITIRDTYRGYDVQSSMFWNILKLYREAGWGYTYEQAYARTDSETAFPGTSEHHDGYTADVITQGVTMNQGFGSTAFGIWLAGNCWDYGFVIRYPQGKESQTTKKYEPWHVRYLGVPTALLCKRYGIVLEEFHAYMDQNRFLLWNCDDQPGSAAEESSDFIYIQCRSGSDLVLPSDITGYSAAADGISGLLSQDGQGRLVLMCRFK